LLQEAGSTRAFLLLVVGLSLLIVFFGRGLADSPLELADPRGRFRDKARGPQSQLCADMDHVAGAGDDPEAAQAAKRAKREERKNEKKNAAGNKRTSDPELWHACRYWMKPKTRFCNMKPCPGTIWCGVHLHQVEEQYGGLVPGRRVSAPPDFKGNLDSVLKRLAEAAKSEHAASGEGRPADARGDGSEEADQKRKVSKGQVVPPGISKPWAQNLESQNPGLGKTLFFGKGLVRHLVPPSWREIAPKALTLPISHAADSMPSRPAAHHLREGPAKGRRPCHARSH
jgi:hypothetical protein